VPSQQTDSVVGLGANLGDRRATLAWAARECGRLGDLSAISSLYETLPVDGPEQPDFLNAAVRLLTNLAPNALLARLLEIERLAGRERSTRWGPRTLDLDILWMGQLDITAPGLVIPHPRLACRPFALVPLLEVAPRAAHPRTGALYSDALAGLDARGVRLVHAGSRWANADA